jgi:hypothetical protein
MPPEQVIQLGGTAGLIGMLLYIVKRLWDAHEREDVAKEQRERENTALLRDLAGSVRQLVEEKRPNR